MRATAGAIIGLLLLGACGKSDKQPMMVNEATLNDSVSHEMKEADPTLPTRLTMAGPQFASMIAASDAFEIAESRLAQQMASLPSTKDFAARMIQAHNQSTAQLQQAVADANPPIVPDPTLSPGQQDKLAALGKLSGPAFDDQYIRDQIEAHGGVLGTLKDYAAHGEMPALRNFATQVSPEVQSHLSMARSLPR